MKQRDFQDFFEMCRTRAIMQALEEDRYDGDVTTMATIRNGEGGRAVITAKAEGVVAGLGVARQVFSLMDESIQVSTLSGDGDRVVPGDVVMAVEGSISSLLVAERTALNFMQRMSGIATRTREFVDRIGHTGAKILDTRKTAPGLRYFDKEAVAAGGGKNHRFGLFDLVLIKDNHIDAAGGVGEAVRRAKEYLAEQGISMKVEAEVRSFEELANALDAGADIVLIDNFAVEEIARAVVFARERAPEVELEASGNVGLHNVAAIAETGVDYISVGELTHSVTALDLSMTIALEK